MATIERNEEHEIDAEEEQDEQLVVENEYDEEYPEEDEAHEEGPEEEEWEEEIPKKGKKTKQDETLKSLRTTRSSRRLSSKLNDSYVYGGFLDNTETEEGINKKKKKSSKPSSNNNGKLKSKSSQKK